MKKSRLRKIGPPIGFFVSRKFAKLRPARDDNAVFWKGGREVECAGLEIRYTVIPYRGFESLPFRHAQHAKARDSRAFVLCAFRAFSNTGAPSNDFPICFVVCHRVS